MRIPCAKCDHLHDSTVTPFMYDIVKEDEKEAESCPPGPGDPDYALYNRYKASEFKCEKCGATNDVMLIWSVLEEEDEKKALRKEEAWAKINKYEKAITNTGKVHYVSTGYWQGSKVEPFCNCRSWVGDYWGKKWDLTDKPVTCKNCLSRMRRMMKEEEKVSGPEDTDRVF